MSAMGNANRCQICKGDGKWICRRTEDFLTEWSCDSHILLVLQGLQYDTGFTSVMVSLSTAVVRVG